MWAGFRAWRREIPIPKRKATPFKQFFDKIFPSRRRATLVATPPQPPFNSEDDAVAVAEVRQHPPWSEIPRDASDECPIPALATKGTGLPAPAPLDVEVTVPFSQINTFQTSFSLLPSDIFHMFGF